MTKHTINESTVRRAIMQRTDISAANKLVLLATLLKVSWETWSGPATVRELATLSGISERSVQTALKKLDNHLISRSWCQFQGRSIPTISLKIKAIMRGAVFSETKNIQGGADSAETKNLRGAVISQEDEKSSSNGEKSSAKDEKSAPLQYIQLNTTNNTTIYKRDDEQKNDINLEQSHSVFSHSQENVNWGQITEKIEAEKLQQKATHPKLQQLTHEQQRIISENVRFTGHAERVRVARKLLNIKLIKGGYYEQI